ncbi:helix-turn-helix domain-containing protein [Luteitalea sp.]
MLLAALFDVDLMRRDMAAKGWLQTDLASAADVSAMTVSRFMRRARQSPRTGAKLAKALGYSPKRYLVRVSAAA